MFATACRPMVLTMTDRWQKYDCRSATCLEKNFRVGSGEVDLSAIERGPRGHPKTRHGLQRSRQWCNATVILLTFGVRNQAAAKRHRSLDGEMAPFIRSPPPADGLWLPNRPALSGASIWNPLNVRAAGFRRCACHVFFNSTREAGRQSAAALLREGQSTGSIGPVQSDKHSHQHLRQQLRCCDGWRPPGGRSDGWAGDLYRQALWRAGQATREGQRESEEAVSRNGAPDWIRTSDPRLRRPMLYPTELRAL